MTSPVAPVVLRYDEARGRWVLLATVLGSGMAMLDSTIVNVALPHIGSDLSAGVSGLQWTSNAYVLTLAALILLGGSLGDRFGRRKVFLVGAVWFAVASVLCALAQSIALLVTARALQGVGGALLTPGSLAIIQSSFAPKDRGRGDRRVVRAGRGSCGDRAVPGWVADPGVLVAMGFPDQRTAVGARGCGGATARSGDPGDSQSSGGLDLPGAALTALTLGLSSWALITWADLGSGARVRGCGRGGAGRCGGCRGRLRTG